MRHLDQTSRLAPEAFRYAYLYGIAFNLTGKTDQAIAVLEAAHRRHPNDREILYGLVAIDERG